MIKNAISLITAFCISAAALFAQTKPPVFKQVTVIDATGAMPQPEMTVYRRWKHSSA